MRTSAVGLSTPGLWQGLILLLTLLTTQATAQDSPVQTVPVQTVPVQTVPEGLVVSLQPTSDVRMVQLLGRAKPDVNLLLEKEFSIIPWDSPALLVPLREARLHSMHVLTHGCTSLAIDLTPELDKASRALDFLDSKTAGEHLLMAQRMLHCQQVAIAAREFARYLFLLGIKDSLNGLSPEPLFTQALAVDSSLPPPTRYAKGIREAFQRASIALPALEKVPVRIQPDSHGLLTRVDGDVSISGNVMLLPGPHLIQQQTEKGEILASAVVRLAKPASSEPVIWPPEALMPEPPERLKLILEDSATRESLDPGYRAALAELPTRTGREWLIFFTPGKRTGDRLGLLVDAQNQLPLELGPNKPTSQTVQKKRQLLTHALVFLASSAVYAGGIAYSRGGGNYSYVLQGLGGTGMAVGAVGVSLSLWQPSIPVLADKQSRSPKTGTGESSPMAATPGREHAH